MRSWMGWVLAVATLGACGDDEESKPACPDISGNWTITSVDVAEGSTCQPDGTPSSTISVSFQKSASGSYAAVIPGVPGGCPGTFDASSCRFTSNCDITVNGAVAASYVLDWTFSGNTLSGTEIGRKFPPAVDPSCIENSKDTGQRL